MNDSSFRFENHGTVIFQGPQTPGTTANLARQKARRY